MRYQELLSWQRIYAWAQAQPPGKIGESCTNAHCPIAKYMEAMTGTPWSVGASIRTLDRAEDLEKPEWMWDLIRKIDELTGDRMGPVSREQFLEVLMQVKEEEK